MDSTAQRIPIEGTYNFRDVGGYPAHEDYSDLR